MFVRNKSIILILHHCFWTQFQSIIHNNASTSEKVFSCFCLLTMYNLWMFLSWFRRDYFFSEESNIMEKLVSYKAFHFSGVRTLTDGLESFVLLEDYCDVFISCLNTHSDGTHSLQMIHWWESDVMLNFSNEQTNSSTFGWTIPLIPFTNILLVPWWRLFILWFYKLCHNHYNYLVSNKPHHPHCL